MLYTSFCFSLSAFPRCVQILQSPVFIKIKWHLIFLNSHKTLLTLSRHICSFWATSLFSDVEWYVSLHTNLSRWIGLLAKKIVVALDPNLCLQLHANDQFAYVVIGSYIQLMARKSPRLSIFRTSYRIRLDRPQLFRLLSLPDLLVTFVHFLKLMRKLHLAFALSVCFLSPS